MAGAPPSWVQGRARPCEPVVGSKRAVHLYRFLQERFPFRFSRNGVCHDVFPDHSQVIADFEVGDLQVPRLLWRQPLPPDGHRRTEVLPSCRQILMPAWTAASPCRQDTPESSRPLRTAFLRRACAEGRLHSPLLREAAPLLLRSPHARFGQFLNFSRSSLRHAPSVYGGTGSSADCRHMNRGCAISGPLSEAPSSVPSCGERSGM